MTNYVADTSDAMCLICRQPLVPTFHEASSFNRGRTDYTLKFELRQTATADLERAVRETQELQKELTEEIKRLRVLMERARALSLAYDEFVYDPGADTVGALFEAAHDVTMAAGELDGAAANEDDGNDQ